MGPIDFSGASAALAMRMSRSLMPPSITAVSANEKGPASSGALLNLQCFCRLTRGRPTTAAAY